jgi:hypothetical protein
MSPISMIVPQITIMRPNKKVELSSKVGDKGPTAFSIMMRGMKKPLQAERVRSSSIVSQASTGTANTEFSDDLSVFERRVTFSDKVRAKFTPSRHCYTAEEIRASWCQKDEYDQIIKSCREQVVMLQTGKKLRETKHCSRGLESHTGKAAINKRQNRMLSYEAVLVKQEEQRIQGLVDEDEIAYLYQQTTSICQLWACTTGLRDQRAAKECMD